MSGLEQVVEIAYAALREIGRDDLADGIVGFEDEDGPYLEYDIECLSDEDWEVIDRAETIGRESIGLPARERPGIELAS